MREAEAARRLIQLRRRDPEVEKDAGRPTSFEPRSCNGGEVFEAGVLDPEARIAPEPLASVSHRVRVFVQSE